MNRNNFARFLAAVGIFGAIALVLQLIPAVTALKFNFIGWQAYAMVILAGIAGSTLVSYLSGFCSGFVSSNFVANPVFRIAAKMVSYTCFAGILIAIGKYAPDRIAIENPVGLYWLFGALGFGYALLDIVEERFFPKTPGTK